MEDIVAKNKDIIFQFVEAVNSKNEELMTQLIHADFQDPEPIPGTGYNINPWPKFLKLLGFTQKIIDHMDNRINSKLELIKEELFWGDILINRHIESIIVENDIAAVIRSATLNDPNKLNLNLTSFQRYWIKKNQIVCYESVTRFLPVLFQLENVIIERNQQHEINEHLSLLRKSEFFANRL